MTERAAKGSALAIEIDASPGTFTTVAQVRNIDGPSLALDPLDVSANDDDPRFYRDFIPGWHDPGEVTVELIWDPADATQGDFPEGLLGIYDVAEVHVFRFQTPPFGAPQTWVFSGIVTGYEPGAPFDEALTATVTIKLVGAPTLS